MHINKDDITQISGALRLPQQQGCLQAALVIAGAHAVWGTWTADLAGKQLVEAGVGVGSRLTGEPLLHHGAGLITTTLSTDKSGSRWWAITR